MQRQGAFDVPIKVEDGQIRAGEMVVEVDVSDAEEPLTKTVSIDVETNMTWPATGKVDSRQVEVPAEEAREIWLESLPASIVGDVDIPFTDAPHRRFKLESNVALPHPTFLDRRLSFKELKDFRAFPDILASMSHTLGVPENVVRQHLSDPSKQVKGRDRRRSRFGGDRIISSLGNMDMTHEFDVPVTVLPLFQSELEPGEWDPLGDLAEVQRAWDNVGRSREPELIDELFTPLFVEETFYAEAKYVVGHNRHELVSGAVMVPASELIETVQLEPVIFERDVEASQEMASEAHI